MDDWFTVEKIDEATYAISEYGHSEKVHSYLLLGSTHALLIDTGLGIGNIKTEVERITGLPIKVVTTHAHWDHIGGHALFQDIWIHREDAGWLINGLPLTAQGIRSAVMEEPFTISPPEGFNIDSYVVYTGTPAGLLEDGDIIDIGNRKVKIIHTPGHSPGHICLLDMDRGYLFTGDLIYKGTLYAFYPSTDPLQFKQSVDKISNLENVTKILPAHNDFNLEPDFVRKVRTGFEIIKNQGLLKQGSGIFTFEGFSIQL